MKTTNDRKRFGKKCLLPLLSCFTGLAVLFSSGCIRPMAAPTTPYGAASDSCVAPTDMTILGRATTDDDVLAAVENIIHCLNDGHYREAALQLTPELLQSEFGFADPELAPQRLAGFPPLIVESMANVQVQADGRSSIDLHYRREVGAHMLVHERWTFTEENGLLRLAMLTPLPVELSAEYRTNKVDVAVRMFDFGYELSQQTFAANSTAVFQVVNDGDYRHEFVVFRLPAGVTMEAVRQGQFSEDFEFIGTTAAAAGEKATDLVLVNLTPGTYAIVCFADDPDGIPHIGRGMISEFTVESEN